MTMDEFLEIQEKHAGNIAEALEFVERTLSGMPPDRCIASVNAQKRIAAGIQAQADLIRVLTWQLQQAVTAQREQQRLAMSMGEPRE